MGNGAIFSMDLVPQYLSFKISYVTYPVLLSTDDHSTQNNRQTCGCRIQILRYIMLMLQFNYLSTSILHIIICNLMLILLTLPYS